MCPQRNDAPSQRPTPILIGVTGGIGAGKSVVCRIAALQGLPLYDCDIEARRIMDSDMRIKQTLAQIAGQEVLRPDGEIDRPLLAKRLFADAEVRRRVNELVHAAVRRHLAEWVANLSAPAALVESAILHTSGLDRMVDRIWLVDAPEQVRIDRVMKRNALTADQVKARIEAQSREFESLPAEKVSLVSNDGLHPLLPQIEFLLNTILSKCQKLMDI